MSNLANSTQIVGGNPLAEMKGTISALVGVVGVLFGAYYAYDSSEKVDQTAYHTQQQDQVQQQQLEQNKNQVERQQLDKNEDQEKRQQLDQNQDQVKRLKQQPEEQPEEQPDDQDDNSDSSISENDSSSDDDTIDESSEDQCQAVRSDGKQCPKEATKNGACSNKAHQRQMRSNLQRLIQMDLDLSEIADIIGRNSDSIIKNINKLMKGARTENHGFIYIYNLPNGLIKIGRTGQNDPRDRWNQQRQYAIKNGPKVWTCRVHNLAEVLVLNILDFARQGRLEEFDARLISRKDMERVIRAVIKAINKFMKRQDSGHDGEEEPSDPHSTHYSDQHK